jgi:hypothetical protein
MQKRDSAPHAQQQLCSFPYALYESRGLIFELFEGGQPDSRHRSAFVSQEGKERLTVLQGGTPECVHQVVW